MDCFVCEEKTHLKSAVDVLEHFHNVHSLQKDQQAILKRYLNVLRKNKVFKNCVCMVCGKVLKNELTLLKHFYFHHPQLGYSQSKFNDDIIKGVVNYTSRKVATSITGGSSSPYQYQVNAGEFRQGDKLNWNQASAAKLFIQLSKIAIEW